jgi:hypothetical protein
VHVFEARAADAAAGALVDDAHDAAPDVRHLPAYTN